MAVVLSVALLVLAPRAAIGRQIALGELFERHPAEVSLVETCGRWESPDQSGFFRLVASDFLFGGSRLWVQWMSDRDQNGRTAVVHTLSLPQINDDHAEYLIGGLSCEASGRATVIRFRAESGHTGATSDVQLVLRNQPGEYELQGL